MDMIDETTVGRHLLTRGLPDPDLLIRTSGEKRVRQREKVLQSNVLYTTLRGQTKLHPITAGIHVSRIQCRQCQSDTVSRRPFRGRSCCNFTPGSR